MTNLTTTRIEHAAAKNKPGRPRKSKQITVTAPDKKPIPVEVRLDKTRELLSDALSANQKLIADNVYLRKELSQANTKLVEAEVQLNAKRKKIATYEELVDIQQRTINRYHTFYGKLTSTWRGRMHQRRSEHAAGLAPGWRYSSRDDEGSKE